jgi:hypothetical protein
MGVVRGLTGLVSGLLGAVVGLVSGLLRGVLALVLSLLATVLLIVSAVLCVTILLLPAFFAYTGRNSTSGTIRLRFNFDSLSCLPCSQSTQPVRDGALCWVKMLIVGQELRAVVNVKGLASTIVPNIHLSQLEALIDRAGAHPLDRRPQRAPAHRASAGRRPSAG